MQRTWVKLDSQYMRRYIIYEGRYEEETVISEQLQKHGFWLAKLVPLLRMKPTRRSLVFD